MTQNQTLRRSQSVLKLPTAPHWSRVSLAVLVGGLALSASVNADITTQNGNAFAAYVTDQAGATNQDAYLTNLLANPPALFADWKDAYALKFSPGVAFSSLSTAAVKRTLAVAASLDAHLDNLASAGGQDSSVSFGVRHLAPSGKNVTMTQPAHESEKDWTAWTSGYSSQSSISGNDAAGYSKIKSYDNGANVGVEHRFGNLRVGALVAVGNTIFHDDNVRVETDTWHVGGYGSVAMGDVIVDASLIYGQGDNTSKREDVTAPGTELRGDFNSNDLQAGVGVAMNLLPKGGSWQLTPLARVKYVNYSQDSFAESGSGAGFTTDKITKETVISKVGARLGYTAEATRSTTLGFDGGVYWVHDYSAGAKSSMLRLTAAGTPDSFEAVGRSADADTAQFNLGVQATFSESLTLRVSGQQEVSNSRQETTGVVSVAVNF
jgi:uncharacterized protein with beta-barrel porin domain